jgi:hypothetical protein
MIGAGVGAVVAVTAAFALLRSPAPVSAPASSSSSPASAAPAVAAAAPVAAAAVEPAPSAEPMPAAAPVPPVVASEPDVRPLFDLATVKGGKLTDKQLASVVGKAESKLERCYDAALEKKPRTEGRLTLGWTVAKSGRALGVRKLSGTIKDKALDLCTVQAIKALRFPKPRRAVQVKLPLEYSRG